MVKEVSRISFQELKEGCTCQTNSSMMIYDEKTSFSLVPASLAVQQIGSVQVGTGDVCSAHYLAQPTLLWLQNVKRSLCYYSALQVFNLPSRIRERHLNEPTTWANTAQNKSEFQSFIL